jgi:integrase
MRVWPHLATFVRHALSQSLQKKCSEDDLVGTFLLSLLTAGALHRPSIDRDLVRLTTDNILLGGRWFQFDAFRPVRAGKERTNTHKPESRNLQVRFPLPLLCQALLYRLALHYKPRPARDRVPNTEPAHQFNLQTPGQPLFPDRIRLQSSFFRNWLLERYAKFPHTYKPFEGGTGQTGRTFPLPQRLEPTWEDLMNACQATLLDSLPPWVVAGLSRRWLSRPSTVWDIERILWGKPQWPHTPPSQSSPPSEQLQPVEPAPKKRPEWLAPHTLPPLLRDLYTEANQILGTTIPGPFKADHRAMQRKVQGLINHLSPQTLRNLAPNQRPVYENARYVFEWLHWLLSSSRSTNTARNYFFNLLIFVYHQFGNTPLADMKSADRLADIVADCMRCYDAPNTQRGVKTSFQSFFGFIAARIPLPPINWRDSNLAVYHDADDRPVFTYRDIDYLLSRITDDARARDKSEAHMTRLQAFVILCFYAGLRRGEAVTLSTDDFDDGPETLLWVGHSKTRAGIRVIPLHLLIPDRHLEILRAQWKAALAQARSQHRESGPLLPTDQGEWCTPESFGQWISTLMKRHLKAGSAHDLRHSFATWFLVRWYLAFHPIPNALPRKEFPDEIFGTTAQAKFRALLLGTVHQGRRCGAESLSRPLSVLHTMLGHACPEITLSIYAHSLDWIYYLHLLQDGANTTGLPLPTPLNIPEIASLLQQTPANLYGMVKRNMPIPRSLHDIVTAQMQRLKLTHP